MLSHLSDAEGWATWDLFGGGLLSDIAKHSALDAAQDAVNVLQSKLRSFKTELVDVNMDKLGRYLTPSKAKLEAKGVASVRSRVVNLTELAPGLTVDTMKANMIRAFEDVYGLSAEHFDVDAAMLAQIAELKELYSSWDYLYGAPLAFTFSCEDKFDWGYVGIQLEAKGGYSNKEKAMLYFVVNRYQIVRMKELVHNIDGSAYITISEVADVFSSNNK